MVKKRDPFLFLVRVAVYLVGLVILCIGIILNTKTGLGVAPINSFPYLISELTPLTLGQAVSILYLFCITAQCIIKRKLSVMILLQLPLSYLFGLLVDFFDVLLDVVHPTTIPATLFWLALAVVCTAFGMITAVSMDLIPNPPDGTVQTLAEFFHKDFGFIKNIFDLTMVTLSILGGLIFPHRIIGVGLGTIVNALLVGRLASLFRRSLAAPMDRLKSASLLSRPEA